MSHDQIVCPSRGRLGRLFLCLSLGLCLVTPALVTPALAQQPPEAELSSLKAAPGMEVSLFASEPLITNPSCIDIDTKGRVWVAEIEWYRAKAKNPPADKIKVLEDTDGDGRADKVTVFADDVFAPMSVCVAGDKVYVATSPDLWVYEDKNGDLRADGPPKKLLTGFGGQNHDHGAHSLVLGPDHKWWMSHGDTGFDVTGVDGSHIKFQWGAMLRGELDGSRLETVSVNYRNPYEISVSSFGESYVSDNDNDGNFSVRICWNLEGGNYGWFGAPPEKVPAGTPFGEHWHFRGHIPGFVPATLVTGFGSPCGMCFYEGDAFGPHYQNAPLHTDAGPREVRIYRHTKAGAGMKATSEVFLSSEGDNYFRPDDICTAPDGSLYVSDWYDGGVGGHAYNNPDQGRIFVLRPTGKTLKPVAPAGPYDTIDEAIVGLHSPNLATQYLARERLLAEGQKSLPALKKLLAGKDQNMRARALWLLDRIGGAARQSVLAELKNDDGAYRALAVRILRRHGDEYAAPILAMASDDSAEVRREVLIALRHLQGENAEKTLVQLAATYDGSDRYLLEAINVAAGDRKEQLYDALEQAGLLTTDKIQLLQVLDAKRATEYLQKALSAANLDEGARALLLSHLGGTAAAEAGEAVLKLATDEAAAPDLRKLALNLLAANLGGNWQELKKADGLTVALRGLLAEPSSQLTTLSIIGDQGLDTLDSEVVKLLGNAKAPLSTRLKAIEVAAQLHSEAAVPTMEKLLTAKEPALRSAALAALVDMQSFAVLKKILTGKNVDATLRAATTDRLMATTGGALVVLRMVEAGALDTALKQEVVARAATHPDSNVRVLYEAYIPADQRPQRLGSAIKPAEILALTADAERGSKIFSQSSAAQCKSCHRVAGIGGTVGPDLSQIGKKYDRGALLETIMEPSKAIAPEYVAYVMETDDGRVFAGFLVEQTEQTTVLKDAEGKLHRIPTAEVVTLEKQQKSLMPELVLKDVTAQDAADLLAYLMSLNAQSQAVQQFRGLGPFVSGDRQGLDKDFGPERDLLNIDLNASYEGPNQQTLQWQVVLTNLNLGYPSVDQVAWNASQNLPTDGATNYFLVHAESAADQDATLQFGGDDDSKLWVNGELVHTHRGDRALNIQDDRIDVRLKTGRNTILIKVVNHQGPGGIALSIAAPGAIQLKTE